MMSVPEYTIVEGGMRPRQVVDEEGRITCPDCGYHGQPDRWSYMIDWEEEEEDAALACPECEQAVCYMTVALAGSPRWEAIMKMQGRTREVIEHDLVRQSMLTCTHGGNND